MSYTITSQCIGCNRCLSACPNHAINQDGDHYWIDSSLCNNCVGHYVVAQCSAVCPTNYGCIPGTTAATTSPALVNSDDYWTHWFEIYNRLVFKLDHAEPTPYWEQWFDRYSEKLSTLMQSHHDGELASELANS